jgi:bifunctional UDP-N-acetylglucosamine pyrophosphorylase / glucosamine-1-phosphate N-acetyltransferase
MPKSQNYAVVILAAGKGKRMKNPDLPKVLVQLDGKELLGHVLVQVKHLESDKNVVVAGHFKEKVVDYVQSDFASMNVEFVEQAEQLGTGHAIDMARNAFADYQGDILILAGDVPLLSSETIQNFIDYHYSNELDCSVLSTIAPDPSGYGRIVRNSEGSFTRIVEQKDSNDDEAKIDEINSGVYLVNSQLLFESLKNVSNENSQGEYYLTDIIAILKADDKRVGAFSGANYEELLGINSPEQLAVAEEILMKMKKYIFLENFTI